MTHATRVLQRHDLLGKGIKLWITFLNTHGHRDFPWTRDQLNGGATSETTRTLKTIHTIHSLIHSNNANTISVIMKTKWYSGDHGGLKLPEVCLRGEEKPRKNLTQETCPDRESNPDPLCDTRMLPSAPRRWTNYWNYLINAINSLILFKFSTFLIVKN